MQNLHKTAYLATALIRRKLCKIADKTPYLNNKGFNGSTFSYTHKNALHILSNFCHTFCDRKSTDYAMDFLI